MSHEPAIRRPSIPPLPPLGRARQVAEALSIYIEAAQLGPGDRLPTERELMQALGVGRSSIREAVSHLQALGVLEARIGSGTYILKPVSAHTVHLPLSIEAGGLADALLLTLEVRRGHRDRGLDRRRPAPHARGPRADRRGARRDGARRTSATGPRASRTWPFTSRSTTPAATRCSVRCWSSCAGSSSSSGAGPSTGRTSPRGRSRSTACSTRRSATATPPPPPAHTRAILDIVEEDIKDMSR